MKLSMTAKKYLKLTTKCVAVYFVANTFNTYIFNNDVNVVTTISNAVEAQVQRKLLLSEPTGTTTVVTASTKQIQF